MPTEHVTGVLARLLHADFEPLFAVEGHDGAAGSRWIIHAVCLDCPCDRFEAHLEDQLLSTPALKEGGRISWVQLDTKERVSRIPACVSLCFQTVDTEDSCLTFPLHVVPTSTHHTLKLRARRNLSFPKVLWSSILLEQQEQ